MYDDTHWQTQRWEKDHRYYIAEIRQDLFGHWELVRLWGRKHSQRGGMKAQMTETYAEACALLADVAKRRTRRGYEARP